MELTLAEKFVRNFYIEKENFRKNTFSLNSENQSSVMKKVKKLQLNTHQSEILEEAISQLLTDVFYSILLGLDGATSIGDNIQETYKIYDEEGNLISDCGEIEAEAYEYFYNKKIDNK